MPILTPAGYYAPALQSAVGEKFFEGLLRGVKDAEDSFARERIIRLKEGVGRRAQEAHDLDAARAAGAFVTGEEMDALDAAIAAQGQGVRGGGRGQGRGRGGGGQVSRGQPVVPMGTPPYSPGAVASGEDAIWQAAQALQQGRVVPHASRRGSSWSPEADAEERAAREAAEREARRGIVEDLDVTGISQEEVDRSRSEPWRGLLSVKARTASLDDAVAALMDKERRQALPAGHPDALPPDPVERVYSQEAGEGYGKRLSPLPESEVDRRAALAAAASEEEVARYIASRLPAQRLADPEERAQLMAALEADSRVAASGRPVFTEPLVDIGSGVVGDIPEYLRGGQPPPVPLTSRQRELEGLRAPGSLGELAERFVPYGQDPETLRALSHRREGLRNEPARILGASTSRVFSEGELTSLAEMMRRKMPQADVIKESMGISPDATVDDVTRAASLTRDHRAGLAAVFNDRIAEIPERDLTGRMGLIRTTLKELGFAGELPDDQALALAEMDDKSLRATMDQLATQAIHQREIDVVTAVRTQLHRTVGGGRGGSGRETRRYKDNVTAAQKRVDGLVAQLRFTSDKAEIKKIQDRLDTAHGHLAEALEAMRLFATGKGPTRQPEPTGGEGGTARKIGPSDAAALLVAKGAPEDELRRFLLNNYPYLVDRPDELDLVIDAAKRKAPEVGTGTGEAAPDPEGAPSGPVAEPTPPKIHGLGVPTGPSSVEYVSIKSFGKTPSTSAWSSIPRESGSVFSIQDPVAGAGVFGRIKGIPDPGSIRTAYESVMEESKGVGEGSVANDSSEVRRLQDVEKAASWVAERMEPGGSMVPSEWSDSEVSSTREYFRGVSEKLREEMRRISSGELENLQRIDPTEGRFSLPDVEAVGGAEGSGVSFDPSSLGSL